MKHSLSANGPFAFLQAISPYNS